MDHLDTEYYEDSLRDYCSGIPDHTNTPQTYRPRIRPHFGPKQVRTIWGIKVGNYYRKICNLRIIFVVKMIGPIQRENASKFVEIETQYLDSEKKKHYYKSRMYLADCGIFPYDDGTWNPTNHLLRM